MWDRIDLHLEVSSIPYESLAGKQPESLPAPSGTIRQRVETARERQRARFTSARSRATCNARMSLKLIKTHCALDEQGEGLIRMAMGG